MLLSQHAEDTKINFFNPQQDPSSKDPLLQLFEMPEKTEDDKILETRIDPLEWKQELDRVYVDLVGIEKEIEILKKQGSDQAEDFEECRRHIELIIEMCIDIRDSSHHEVRRVFSDSIDALES